jgi:hypothetical protein
MELLIKLLQKDINLLRFDFVIIENDKLLFLIEFNGIQHYENRKPFYKNYNDFEVAKNRDMLKIKYCKENGLKLYIIKYDDDIKQKFDIIKNYYKYGKM